MIWNLCDYDIELLIVLPIELPIEFPIELPIVLLCLNKLGAQSSATAAPCSERALRKALQWRHSAIKGTS